MKASKKGLVVAILLGTFGVQQAQACHVTNKWEIKPQVEAGYDHTAWSEIKGSDYVALTAAVVGAIATFGAGSPAVMGVITAKLTEIAQTLVANLGAKIAQEVLEDVIVHGSIRSIDKFRVGLKSFNHKECMHCGSHPRFCISTPNTHGIFVQWKNNHLLSVEPLLKLERESQFNSELELNFDSNFESNFELDPTL